MWEEKQSPQIPSPRENQDRILNISQGLCGQVSAGSCISETVQLLREILKDLHIDFHHLKHHKAFILDTITTFLTIPLYPFSLKETVPRFLIHQATKPLIPSQLCGLCLLPLFRS